MKTLADGGPYLTERCSDLKRIFVDAAELFAEQRT
jgi:hypothetical protein